MVLASGQTERKREQRESERKGRKERKDVVKDVHGHLLPKVVSHEVEGLGAPEVGLHPRPVQANLMLVEGKHR